jgi:hypothetical protein
MAATKTVLRVNNNRAIVRIVGTAAADTATITLNTDLVGSGDALTAGGTPTANISMIKSSTLNSITVARNGTTVAALYGADLLDQPEFVQADSNTSDIVVTFVGGAGAIWLDITKVAGYSPKMESAQFGGGDNIAAVGS